MARPSLVSDAELVESLAGVFKAEGFEGASLAALSEASGLQRASLYHRFPGGKEQMAEEVLRSTEAFMQKHIISMLEGDAPAQQRVQDLVKGLRAFYDGGRRNCLLNKLAASGGKQHRLNKQIAAMMQRLTVALGKLAVDAGLKKDAAHARAERTVMLLEGSLVMCRGLGTTAPFESMLRQLPAELLGK